MNALGTLPHLPVLTFYDLSFMLLLQYHVGDSTS